MNKVLIESALKLVDAFNIKYFFIVVFNNIMCNQLDGQPL